MGGYYFMNHNNRKNWFAIILIIGICSILGLLIGVYIRENKQNPNISKSSTETPSAVETATPEPIPAEIPKVMLKVDDISYELNGTYIAKETSASFKNPQKVAMGKGSVINLSFEEQPDSYNITLYRDDEIIFTGKTSAILQDDIPANGEYQGVCEAIWEVGEFIGSVSYNFSILADFPTLAVISATETVPGELIVLKLKYINPDETIDIETDLDFKPNIFKYNDECIILLPVSYYHKQNAVYSFKVKIGDDSFSYAIEVKEKEFTVQQLTIDTKIAAETRNDKSAQEVKEKIDPLRPVCDDIAYWEGDFIMPVEGGRVREYDFGKRRHVNGSPTSYRHNGLDIGHDLGVPVMASNSGRILIADYMIGTGNTVIIEHGFGLKTWYYHMDELNVKTGDMIKKGDLIGKVGSTGFSTGPHLHFSASINWVYINPITLINEGIPLISGT